MRADIGLTEPGAIFAEAQRLVRGHYQWIIIGSVIGSAIGAVTAQRVHPVVLLHAGIAVLGFPQALPMVRPAALPARKNEDVGRLHLKLNTMNLIAIDAHQARTSS